MGKTDGAICPSILANKYRASWLRASDDHRQSLCRRLGVQYTHAGDEQLLTTVSRLQQEEYERVKAAKEQGAILIRESGGEGTLHSGRGRK